MPRRRQGCPTHRSTTHNRRRRAAGRSGCPADGTRTASRAEHRPAGAEQGHRPCWSNRRTRSRDGHGRCAATSHPAPGRPRTRPPAAARHQWSRTIGGTSCGRPCRRAGKPLNLEPRSRVHTPMRPARWRRTVDPIKLREGTDEVHRQVTMASDCAAVVAAACGGSDGLAATGQVDRGDSAGGVDDGRGPSSGHNDSWRVSRKQ